MFAPYCPKVKSVSASAVESTCVCARYIIICTSRALCIRMYSGPPPRNCPKTAGSATKFIGSAACT